MPCFAFITFSQNGLQAASHALAQFSHFSPEEVKEGLSLENKINAALGIEPGLLAFLRRRGLEKLIADPNPLVLEQAREWYLQDPLA